MSKNEAKVRVRLDTAQAKKALSGLGREGAASAGRVNASVSGGGGGFAGGAMMGAGLAAGFSAVRGAAMSGIGPWISEGFSGVGAGISHFFGGDEARGISAAREKTKASMSDYVAMTGDLDAAKRQFELEKSIEVPRQIGGNAIDQAIGGQALRGVVDNVEAGAKKVIDSIKDAGDKLLEKLENGHHR